MKKFLIASAATAALAFAAPALAQVSVGETVQGTVTTPSVAPPMAQATSPATAADETAGATITTPDAHSTISAAAGTAEDAAEPAEVTAMVEAETLADAPSQTVQANVTTNAAASGDLPTPVQVAVADGRYTTDDLNRAQLEALRGGPGR